ncbi:MAG TPA: aspartyl/asparaginyl beta-hydroxylase domain-containing protein [Pyrinomonadaceae bacterium]|nr:aspartyl/asparaginyl beta-hydroxylase domain-containing protein [Pyrinomonadaceae bacterium]
MNSRIISAVELDDELLRQDIEKILGFGDVKEEYSEYRFGTWKNYVLWNGSGDEKDTLFEGTRGGAVKTGFGRQLEYVSPVIEENFRTERLKMVRANLLRDAVLVPHRDYVEFKEDSSRLARLHIPLQTDRTSLHAEGDDVFHMRRGEVWYLDVSNIHSACNMSDSPRISLVLDFCLDGQPLETAFKHPERHRARREPLMVEREPVDEEFLKSIFSMGHVINHVNYRDIVLFLSRIHFYKDVSLDVFFDWLIRICQGAQDKSLVEKSVRFKRYMIDKRELSQRFAL